METKVEALWFALARPVEDVFGTAVPRRVRALLGAVEQYHWVDVVWSFVVVILAYAIGRVVTVLVLRALAAWARRTETMIDDGLLRHGSAPLRLLVPALTVRAALPVVSLPDAVDAALLHLTLVLAISATGWFAFGAVRVVEDLVDGRQQNNSWGPNSLKARAFYTQLRGFRNIFGFVIVVLTLAFALMTFETVRHIGTGLLASAGVAGVVLGFAAQRSIAAILAGIQVAVTRPISVDDVVVLEGEWGRIEEVTLTYVVVRLWDLRRLIVPIGYFLEKPFQNWSRISSDVLGNVQLRVSYEVPVEDLRTEFTRVLGETSLWDRKVFGVQVTDADERGMIVRLLMSAGTASDAFDLRCEIREKMIAFVRARYRNGLPSLLTTVAGGEPAGAPAGAPVPKDP